MKKNTVQLLQAIRYENLVIEKKSINEMIFEANTVILLQYGPLRINKHFDIVFH